MHAPAIWSGSISFGLVNIPVKLYTAVSRKTVRFNQIDTRTGARVKQKRVSGDDGAEVPYEDIVKGYELLGGTVRDRRPRTSWPRSTRRPLRTIDIEEFVDLADIDPIFYDAAYYLAPDKAAVKPYALLAQAMEEAGKVGIARFVMRSKQYLAAVRPGDGQLVLSTMVYADEINDPTEIPELDDVDDVDVTDKELAMAEQLVESLSADFEPEKYQDTYREEVLDLIERKAGRRGRHRGTAAAAEASKVVDLMAALEASVAAAKEPASAIPPPLSRGRRRRGDDRRGGDAGQEATQAPAEEGHRQEGPARSRRRPQVGLTRERSVDRWRRRRTKTGRDRRAAARAVATSTRCCTRRSGSPRARSSTTTRGSRR